MKRVLGVTFFFAMAAVGAGCGSSTTSTTSAGSTTSTSGTGGAGTTGSTSATTGTGGDTGAGGGAPGVCADGNVSPTLPPCDTPASSQVEVVAGCEPDADGTLHDAEWKDAGCFDAGPGDMVVKIKHAAGAVYLATAGAPTCGCPMQFYFQTADGKNFVVAVFDDPFNVDGDRSDFTLTEQSELKMAAVDKSIVTACPGMQPSPIRYEWKIPLAKLGLSAGMPGQFKLAIVHAGAHWPAGLSLTAQGIATYAADEPTWGVVSSTSW